MAEIPFLGCKISLISKCDIRYEGILYCVDAKESTIALSKVKSYGTEDRADPNSASWVGPKNEVYDIIIFRASDVKDLRVDTPEPPGLSDPAIISAHKQAANPTSSAAPSSSSKNAETINQPAAASAASDRIVDRVERGDRADRGERPDRSDRGDRGDHGDRRQNDMRRSGPQNNNNNNRGYRKPADGRPPYRLPMDGNRRPRSGDRNPSQGYRGQRNGEPRKYENEYDFEGSNQKFLELEAKFKNLKLKNGNESKEGDKLPTEKFKSKSPAGDRGDRGDRGNRSDRVDRGDRGDRGDRRHNDMRRNGPHNNNRGYRKPGDGRPPYRRRPMDGHRRQRSGDRNPNQGYRGPRKSAPLKFEGEYDFDGANQEFLELEAKKENETKEGDKLSTEKFKSKSPAGDSESGSGYDSEDHKNDSNDEANAREFYDKTISFFDKISCEASERSQGKVGKPDWRKERQLNAETFGVSANYRRGGGYRGRVWQASSAR